MPTLARAMRAQPLPPDTLVLIRIAAGCAETSREAARLAGVSSAKVREAAVLYLQHVLFASDSDCYRVLGVQRGASRSEMREHLRWLMQWLHPDHNPDEWESVFAERVLAAWREANTRESQGETTEAALPAVRRATPTRSRRLRQRWVAVPLQPARKNRRRKMAVLILIAGLGLAASLVPGISPVSKWLTPGMMEADISPAAH